jgi:hypothetical protein
MACTRLSTTIACAVGVMPRKSGSRIRRSDRSSVRSKGTGGAPVAQAARRRMQRDVMEDGVDPVVLHPLQHAMAVGPRRQQHVVHVGVVRALRRHPRPPQPAARLGLRQQVVVVLPGRLALLGDAFGFLQLRPEESGDQFARQEGGARFLPRVLVHFAPEKAAAVGALLADDLRPLRHRGVVHQQGAAFAGNDVLGFVEAVGAQVADAAERASLVRRHDALGRVFHHAETVRLRQGHDRVHLARHAGVVHRNDGPRPGRDGLLDPALVQVEGVLADVDEHRHAAPQHEGIRRRDEGVRGHDHLIARLDVQQQRGHLQRRRAGMGEQGLGAAGLALQPGVALLGEGAVARQRPVEVGPGDVEQLLARHVRLVERNLSFHRRPHCAAGLHPRVAGASRRTS